MKVFWARSYVLYVQIIQESVVSFEGDELCFSKWKRESVVSFEEEELCFAFECMSICSCGRESVVCCA